MTALGSAFRVRLADVPRAFRPVQAANGLGLVALGSLFVRSERYPVVVEVGSVAIRLQDILFGALIAAMARRLLAWARDNSTIASMLAIFLALMLVSAARSPAGTAAVVAVCKYIEFVVAGVAIGLVLRRYRRPDLVTAVLTCGAALIGMLALVELLRTGGLEAAVDGRSGGPLSMESAAAAAAATMVWCGLRLGRLNSRAERWWAVAGILSAGVVLVAAKSVLVVGLGIAILVLASALRWKWLLRAAFVIAVLLVVMAVGRASDIRSALGTGPRSTPPPADWALPAPGTPPAPPLAYWPLQPDKLTGGSFVHRIALAYVGVRIAVDAPLLGHGWLATSSADFLQSGPYDAYVLERFPRLDPSLFPSNYPTASHNAYIQTFAEAGALAAVALVGILLLALVPGLAALRRHRTVAPWPVACGTGWLIVVIVFLTSSALFGGQLETCLLGVSVALCAGAGAERVTWRGWLAALGITTLIVALFVAFLTLPAAGKDGSRLLRVVATDAEGREVNRVGTTFHPVSDAALSNGLVRAWVHGDQLMLRTETPGALIDTSTRRVALAPGLRASRKAVLAARSANVVKLAFVDATNTTLAVLTMARGVPGVYLSLVDQARLEIPGADGLAVGPQLQYAESPIRRVQGMPVRALTPVLVSSAREVRVLLPLQRTVLSAAGKNLSAIGRRRLSAYFLGVYPFHRSAPRLRAGAYAVRESRRPGPAHIRRAATGPAPVWARRSRFLVPFALADERRSGVAEIITLGFTYRAAAPR